MTFRSFFRSKTVPLTAVAEVNSDAIRVIVFEEGFIRSAPGIPVPIIIKKLIFPVASTSHMPVRIAIALRESLFTMVKQLGRVPQRITIAIGGDMAEQSLTTWSIRPPVSLRFISRNDLEIYFKNLLEQQRVQGEKVLLVYPTDIMVNGYSLLALPHAPATEKDRFRSGGSISLSPGVRDIVFHIVQSLFAPDVGSILTEARRGLGGMPIEFVPIPVVVAEATCRVVDASQVLLIEINRFSTTVTFVDDCVVRGVASFAHGYTQWVDAVAKRYRANAENLLQQYAGGMVTAAERSLLESILPKEIDRWNAALKEALETFYPLGPLPADIRLFGVGATVPEVSVLLRSSEAILNCIATRNPSIRILTGESMFSGNTFGGAIGGPAEVGIASLIYFSLYHRPVV